MKPLVDISSYNRIKNWQLAANQTSGFIFKSSQGSWQDSTVLDKILNATAINARFGLYPFYQPDQEPQYQMDSFLNVYMPLKFKAFYMLDVEDIHYFYNVYDEHGAVVRQQEVWIKPPAPSVYTKWISYWLDMAEQHTGVVPAIYTRAEYWNRCIQRSTKWKRYPLVVANYGVLKPTLPLDWTTWFMWQNKSNNLFDWAEGDVDTDVVNPSISEADFDKLFPLPKAVPAPTPTPVPTPVPTPQPGFKPYDVRINGKTTYILTVRIGPGSIPLQPKVSSDSYLTNYECPADSKETYTILEEKLGWGRIATPFAGWINLVNTIKA